jgi:hypothetical protein
MTNLSYVPSPSLRLGTSLLTCLNNLSLLVAADTPQDMQRENVAVIKAKVQEVNAFDSNVMAMNILFLLAAESIAVWLTLTCFSANIFHYCC